MDDRNGSDGGGSTGRSRHNSSTASSAANSSGGEEDPAVRFRISSPPSMSSKSNDSNKLRSRKNKEKPPGCRSKWSQVRNLYFLNLTVSDKGVPNNWWHNRDFLQKATYAERAWWIFTTPFRMLLCISNVTVFFVTYFGFMLPVLWAKPVWPRFYWFCEGKLYVWLQAFIGYWGYTADYDIYEFGDDIQQYCENDRVLLICNHQSTADVPTLFSILQSKGVAPRKAMWLMDVMFRWTPFGIIGRIHGDYFIRQGKATRELELDRLRAHLRKVFWDRDRRWVILFPEGGFYYNRVESSQRYAKQHGFPHLVHTTLPRMGAVQAILKEVGPRLESDGSENTLTKSRSSSTSRLKLLKDTVDALREKKYVKETRPPIKYVIDVTIAYPNGHPLSLLTLSFGSREKCDIAVNYKVYKASDVPFNDDIGLRDWMYKVYEEKDKMLDNYYKYGAFNPGEKGNRIEFSWYEIIGMYAFWFISFIIQLKLYPWIVYKFFAFLYGY